MREIVCQIRAIGERIQDDFFELSELEPLRPAARQLCADVEKAIARLELIASWPGRTRG
jgi:hypothetical protein